MIKKILALVIVLGLIPAFAFVPPKTVTATVGYSPGSGNENSFRGVASIIEKNNPEIKFVVQNKPGVGEIIALNWFMKQPGDGQNIYVASQQSVFTTIETWYADQAQFNPMDMELVTTIAKSPLAIVANVSSKTNTPKELVERLKNTKEPISIGIGADSHKVVFEYLMHKIKGNSKLVQGVMYRGPVPVAMDVIGNQIEFGVMPTAVAYQFYKAGKIKYIALASETKMPQLPDVPLWKDTVPGLNVYGAWMIALPPGTPRKIVDYYRDLFVPAINSQEAKKFFDENLMFAVPSEQTPEGARAAVIKLREQWIPHIKLMKLQ